MVELTRKEHIKQKARTSKSFYEEIILLSSQTKKLQKSHIERYIDYAAEIGRLFEEAGFIQKIDYNPKNYWKFNGKKKIISLDGGVARLTIPTSAPVALRVGKYMVKPGDHSNKRESFYTDEPDDFFIADLFDEEKNIIQNAPVSESGSFEFFTDHGKLKDASRIIIESAALMNSLIKEPDTAITLLQGPLVNPAGPYGYGKKVVPGEPEPQDILFPPYTKEIYKKIFPFEKKIPSDEDERRFIQIYAKILIKIKETGMPAYGIVERPTRNVLGAIIRRNIEKLVELKKISKSTQDDLFSGLSNYQITDDTLLDLILKRGEFIGPIEVNKQIKDKWPQKNYTHKLRRSFPNAMTSYLKTSEFSLPIRVETLDLWKSYLDDMKYILHSSTLLGKYSFPLNLDIADKFGKVPSWISKAVVDNYKINFYRNAQNSGNQDLVEQARKMILDNRRYSANRPTIKKGN